LQPTLWKIPIRFIVKFPIWCGPPVVLQLWACQSCLRWRIEYQWLAAKKLSVNRPPRSYRFWGPAAWSYRFWGPLGTIWDHLGPLGTIWGPSGDHHSKKLSIFSHFSSKYVIFSQKHTFQILDAHFPKRFRLKPHINQKSLKKVFQKMAVPNRFYWMSKKN